MGEHQKPSKEEITDAARTFIEVERADAELAAQVRRQLSWVLSHDQISVALKKRYPGWDQLHIRDHQKKISEKLQKFFLR